MEESPKQQVKKEFINLPNTSHLNSLLVIGGNDRFHEFLKKNGFQVIMRRTTSEQNQLSLHFLS